jgi:hypothetical protein
VKPSQELRQGVQLVDMVARRVAGVADQAEMTGLHFAELLHRHWSIPKTGQALQA